MNITKQNRINFEQGREHINTYVNLEEINEKKEYDAVTIEEIFNTFRYVPVLDEIVKRIKEDRKRGFKLYY